MIISCRSHYIFLVRRFILSGLCMAALSACSVSKMKVSVATDPLLNLDDHQHSLPVVLRIYQLSDPRLFQSAHFSALWKEDAAVLAHDMLAREEILLQPGQSQVFHINWQKETEYVAALALFRDTRQERWRVIQPAKKGLTGRYLHLALKDNNITIQK